MVSDKKNKKLKIEIDESIGQGEYANFAIVTHSAAEFVLDFIRILPGLTKSKVKFVKAEARLNYSVTWRDIINITVKNDSSFTNLTF